jgi:hypothetical protein
MNLGQKLTSKFGNFQKESWEYVSDDVDLQTLDRNYDRFCGCTKYCVPLLAFFFICIPHKWSVFLSKKFRFTIRLTMYLYYYFLIFVRLAESTLSRIHS